MPKDKSYHKSHERLKSGISNRSRGENPKRHLPGKPTLFVIAMIPLNYILRKCTVGKQFTKSLEINHLMYMDDIKLFSKNEIELEILIQTVRIYRQNAGLGFDIEKCAMTIIKVCKEKRRLERWKIKNNCECSKRTSSKKRRLKKKLKKSNSEEQNTSQNQTL